MNKIFLALLITAQFNLFGQNRFVLSEQLLDSIICLTQIGSYKIPNVKANCNEKQQKHFYLFRFMPRNNYEIQISYIGIDCSPDIPSGIYGIYAFGNSNLLILNDGVNFDENLSSKILLSSDPLYNKIIEKHFVKYYDGITVYNNLPVLSVKKKLFNGNKYVIKSNFYMPYAKAPKELWPIKNFQCNSSIIEETYAEEMTRYTENFISSRYRKKLDSKRYEKLLETRLNSKELVSLKEEEQKLMQENTWKVKITLEQEPIFQREPLFVSEIK